MGIWDQVLGLVKTGKVVVSDASALVTAAIAAYHDVQSGAAKTPLESMINQAAKDGSNLLPVLEDVANLLFPGSGTGVAIGVEGLAFVLSHAHKMTPSEETAWMDRASNPYAGGA